MLAQDSDSTKKLDPIEINFLSNYYKQQGNHSPVNGGDGSEELSNITEQITISIPVKRNFKINLNGGIEFFSSASQNSTTNNGSTHEEEEEEDKLAAKDDDDDDDDDDDEHVSGASQNRGLGSRSKIVLFDVGLSKENNIKNMIFDGGLGFYRDENAISGSYSVGWTKSTKDNNNTFNLGGNYYLDKWTLKEPDTEIINGTSHLGNGIRQTFNASFSYSRVLHKKITAAIIADFTYQKGLLSTPYHKVYFADNELPALERLPDTRMKYPVALKLNYHATDFLIFRTYYRYYKDNWGISGNTISIETPIKASQWLRIYPFYRFHIQTATEHFGAINTFSSSDTYYTADYDLSALTTHKIGVGFSISPVNGIFHTQNKKKEGRSLLFKSIDFRYAYYTRSDGLTGHMFTAGLNLNIHRKD